LNIVERAVEWEPERSTSLATTPLPGNRKTAPGGHLLPVSVASATAVTRPRRGPSLAAARANR